MGLAIAVFYIPILLAFTGGAVFLTARLNGKDKTKQLRGWRDLSVLALGAIMSAGSCFVFAWLIPEHGNTDFLALFLKMGIALVMPFVIGLSVVAIAKYVVNQETNVALVLQRIGVGSLHAVWLLPYLLYAYASYR